MGQIHIASGKPKRTSLPKICAYVFFGCFFLGVLSANLAFSDEALWIGFLNENHIRQFAAGGRQPGDFFLFALKNRVFFWILPVLCGAFSAGAAVCGLCAGWLGVTGGFVMTALIRRYGFRGIFVFCGAGFPHDFIYLAAFAVLAGLIGAFRRRSRGAAGGFGGKADGGRQIAVYFLFAALISLIFFAGILTEYYVNPFILEMMKPG